MRLFFSTRRDIDSLENRDPVLIDRIARLLKPLLWRTFRPVVRGLERIPPGRGIYVGNHNAALLMPEVYLFGAALYDRFGMAELPYGMGHSLGIRLPLLHELLVPLGAVRASSDNASRVLGNDQKILIYPGGELDSMRSWWQRERVVFGARRGYIRLALRESAPIIPVVTAGAHETLFILYDGQALARWLGISRWLRQKTWPVVLCLPWGLWVGVPPPHIPLPTQIYLEVLAPITFERTGPAAARDGDYVEACHHQVHGAMQRALTRLSAERKRTKGVGP